MNPFYVATPTEGANFYPLDSIRNDNPDSANDNDHNDYFGMRYDIEFKIGDYLGDLDIPLKVTMTFGQF